MVGEEFVPLGEDNHEPHLARIRAAKPDVVLISLIGTDSVTFNRAFGECGLGATTLRLAGAMDETVLLGIGADNSENMFCASGYFPGVGSRANDDFQSRYGAMFGPNAPPIGSLGQSSYEGPAFLEAAANQAGACRSGRCSRRRVISSIAAPAVPSPSATVTRGCRCISPRPTGSTSS